MAHCFNFVDPILDIEALHRVFTAIGPIGDLVDKVGEVLVDVVKLSPVVIEFTIRLSNL